MVDELGERLVWVECKLLFAGQCGVGVGVSMGIKGIGVDGTIASISEEFGRLCIKVILVEGGNNFSLTVEDQVGEYGHVAGFVMVDKPPNPWMEAMLLLDGNPTKVKTQS